MRRLITFAIFAILACAPIRAQQIVNGNRVHVSGTGINAQCPNDATTGTTINLLAKFTSTGCIKIGTGDTAIPVFIVTSASATTGNASLAVSGQASCVMDTTIASNAEGDYVIASTTTAGDCHPQSAQPSSTFVVGILQDNSTTSGLAAKVNIVNAFYSSGTPCTTTNLSLQIDNSGAFGCATPFTFASNTITAAAAGIVDLHAETGATGLQIPVIAGANPSTTNGAIAYDSTQDTYQFGDSVLGKASASRTVFADNCTADSNCSTQAATSLGTGNGNQDSANGTSGNSTLFFKGFSVPANTIITAKFIRICGVFQVTGTNALTFEPELFLGPSGGTTTVITRMNALNVASITNNGWTLCAVLSGTAAAGSTVITSGLEGILWNGGNQSNQIAQPVTIGTATSSAQILSWGGIWSGTTAGNTVTLLEQYIQVFN